MTPWPSRYAGIGVAMGSGSPATPGAPHVVLDGRFWHLPEIAARGWRVIADIERAASLFLVKNIYWLVVPVNAAVTRPRIRLAVAPVLALDPGRRRYVRGFLRRVLRFAFPAGPLSGTAADASSRAIRALDPRPGSAGPRHRDADRVGYLAVDTAGPGPSAGRLEASSGHHDGRRVGNDRARPGA